MKRLAILGAGGHGKNVADAALLGEWSSVVFFDDKLNKKDLVVNQAIEGNAQDLLSNVDKFDGIHIAIGRNEIRRKKFIDIQKVGGNIVSIVHPSASISKTAIFNTGSAILANVVLNSDTKIGKGVIISHSSNIDHDGTVGDFVLISPGCSLAGTIKLGNYCSIGTGSSFINNIEVGSGAIIGAGSVVVSNIPGNTVSFGVPCKVSKKLDK